MQPQNKKNPHYPEKMPRACRARRFGLLNRQQIVFALPKKRLFSFGSQRFAGNILPRFTRIKRFMARLKTTLFKKRTQFANALAYGKGEAARSYIMCALKYRAARGKPHGFPLKSRKNDLSAQIIFREPKTFMARLKTTLFKKRTQFAAYLRSQRVNAARMIWCAPKKRAAEGRALKSRKNDLSAQIILREPKQFKARLKTTLFKKRTQFANALAYGKGEAARSYIMCALKYRAARGKPHQFPLKSRKNDLSAQIIFREPKTFTNAAPSP